MPETNSSIYVYKSVSDIKGFIETAKKSNEKNWKKVTLQYKTQKYSTNEELNDLLDILQNKTKVYIETDTYNKNYYDSISTIYIWD